MGLYSELTPRLALVSFIGSLGALSFGYDNGWWGFILGAPYFNDQYGRTVVTDATTGATSISLSASEQSAGTGLGTAGIMIGCMIAPWFNEKFGRKKSFALLAVVGLIGALIQAVSTVGRRYWVLIAGKIILNISVGIASAVVGVYLSECAPASLRGTLMSNYNIIQNIGYVLAAGTVYGVVTKTTSINWLLPICLQFILPAVILSTLPLIPESPRWLVAQGRLDEATNVIRSLRKYKSQDDDALIYVEVEEIRAAYEEMRKIHDGVGWIELFRGANLRRTLVAIGLQSLQQAQGVSFVSNYALITLIGLGISNVYTIVMVLYVVLFVSSLGAFYFPDKIGRRALLLIGSASCATWMAVIGAITTKYAAPTGGMAHFLVVSLFLWVAIFANTWSIIPWTVAAEIPSNPLREKTLALASWSGFGVGLAVGFIVPYIQNAEYGDLGGKIAFLWMGFSIISGVFVYFFLPELKGRTLEELDYMFEARIPTRQFRKFDSSGMLAEKKHEHGTDKVVGEISMVENTDVEKGGSGEDIDQLERV
ncbi:general substrate transporter [Naematelia encephala]|uniref:General substrate transporter n=1 Tax=Naematelia encephala TaxID=71784 RepID=A0A1Y2AWX0_9TREE|nr:general substrate transporter [Naematelia encephala]